MGKFAVFSDSPCDLPASLIKKHDINLIPFKVSFDRKSKLTEGVDITNEIFYQSVKDSPVVPKTYYPSVRDYVTEFKKSLDAQQDILCLCLSSGLSKSYVSALSAGKILSRTYKDRKIMVMDTLSAAGKQGLLVLDAVKLRDNSSDIQIAYKKLEEVKKTGSAIITVTSMDQLVKGGRMSASTAVFGKLLGINPVIGLQNGALAAKGKARGRRNALNLINKLCLQDMDGKPENFDLCVIHSNIPDEASILANDLKSVYGMAQTIPPLEIGATIGAHTGPTTIGICFCRKI